MFQEILNRNFTIVTTERQKNNGTIQFRSNFKIRKSMFKDDCYINYIIYKNGKIRRSAPGIFTVSRHIVSDLKKPIETNEDLIWAVNKIVKSIDRNSENYLKKLINN